MLERKLVESQVPLHVKSLQKTYSNGVNAVRGVDLQLEEQQVHALLGPNGAGKTTTIKSVLGFIRYEGDAKVFGQNIDRVRDRIAFVPEEKQFYDFLTPRKALKWCQKLNPHFDPSRGMEFFAHFSLPLDKKIKSFSHGMKTSLYLSLTFAQQADLYIFDEPTWGLDPIKRDDVLQMVRDRVIDGKTVLYTSHIIPEVQQIADKVSIMANGKILFTGFLDEIKERFRIVIVSPEARLDLQQYPVMAVARSRDQVSLLTDTDESFEHFNRISISEPLVPGLEEFFQVLIRGDRHVL